MLEHEGLIQSRLWRGAVAAILLTAVLTGCSGKEEPAPPKGPDAKEAVATPTEAPPETPPVESPPPDAGADSQPAESQPAEPQPDESQPAASQPEDAAAEASQPAEPELVTLQFMNTPVQAIMALIYEKTGKPIIPRPEVLAKKITIFCPEKVHPDQVLPLVYAALLDQGVVVSENDTFIKLLPVEAAVTEGMPGPTTRPGVNDRTFQLRYVEPVRVKEILDTLKSPYAKIAVNEAGHQIILTDNSENIERLASLIEQLDVPGVDDALIKVFRLEYSDATAVAESLRNIVQAGGAGRSGPSPGKNEIPVIIVADTKKNWVIASADAERMSTIETLVAELDQMLPPDVIAEMIDVLHVDTEELVGKLNQLLEESRRSRQTSNLRIVSYEPAKKILVFGSSADRRMIREMIEELDTESAEKRIQRVFKLTYADAGETAEQIEQFHQESDTRNLPYWARGRQPEKKVRAIPVVRTNTVLVMASPADMEEIEKQIKEVWDIRVDEEELAPRVYHLEHSNAEDVATLLEDIFTDFEDSGGDFWDRYFGRSTRTQKRDVGRLFGTLRFEPYPRSNSIVVVASSVQAFDVVEATIKDLDAEIPGIGNTRMIYLLYADAEDVCERLNSLFSPSGTLAEINRANVNLVPRAVAQDNQNQNQNQANQQRNQEQTSPGRMTFWWQRAQRQLSEEEITQLIGQIRIVPYQRTRSLLVTAPPEYMSTIEELITQLDQPARQVLIRAVIAEIRLEDLLNLGMHISSDTINVAGEAGFSGRSLVEFDLARSVGSGTLTVGTDLNVLLQFLKKKTDLRIRSSPSVFTADNQQAEFFDGQDVPFITESHTTDQGGLTEAFDYKAVGIVLQVLPHITQTGDVDMTINIEMSSIRQGETLFGGFIVDRRQTKSNLVVKNGQTVVISGILRKEDLHVVRRVPVLGYIPVLDLFFSRKDVTEANTELLLFVTPYVAETTEDATLIGQKELDRMDRMIPPDLLEEGDEVLKEERQE